MNSDIDKRELVVETVSSLKGQKDTSHSVQHANTESLEISRKKNYSENMSCVELIRTEPEFCSCDTSSDIANFEDENDPDDTAGEITHAVLSANTELHICDVQPTTKLFPSNISSPKKNSNINIADDSVAILEEETVVPRQHEPSLLRRLLLHGSLEK